MKEKFIAHNIILNNFFHFFFPFINSEETRNNLAICDHTHVI